MRIESMKTIGIIGLGLIGGSMAVDLRRRGFAGEIIGVEAEPVNAAAALKMGLVDRIVDLKECVQESDVVIVAVPVGAATGLLPQVLDWFSVFAQRDGDCKKVVMDVCSTKEQLASCVNGHPFRNRYVSTHPMAGTEYSGPWAAMAGLFDGHACIICAAEDSAPDAVKMAEDIYDTLNMRVIYMEPSAHDVHAAYVSHISHITSFALALTVLEKEKDEKHIFDLASGGFSSTVRLAKSSPDMWTPILSQNKDNVLHVMDTYIEKMQAFRQAIAEGNEAQVRDLIEEANRIRRIIR